MSHPYRKRRQRQSRLPMSPENKPHVEITFYAGLAGFIGDPCHLTYNRLLRTLDVVDLAMRQQGIADYTVQIRSAQLAMRAVRARFCRTGALAVTSLEAWTLRTAAPHIKEAIGHTRLDTFLTANAVVRCQMHQAGVAFTD